MEKNRGLLVGGIISAAFAVMKLCGINISWAMVIAPVAVIAGLELTLVVLLVIVATLRILVERRIQRREEEDNEEKI